MGDYVFFTDWRGDPDEKMRDDGPTISELFCAAAERGVVVKGLMWRSHLDKLAYSEEENRHLGEAIERAGGEVLLDQRVRFGGSHHQKLVVIRHPRAPERDVAFAGGIDLCHSRRDDEKHRGDRQAQQMSPQYGDHPPWHDVQLRLRGPVVGALDTTFRERWNDPAPLDMLSPVAWLHGQAARRRPRTRSVARPAARSAAVWAAHRAGAAHLSRRALRIRLRAARRTQHRPRVLEGDSSAPNDSSIWRTSTCGRSGSPSCSRAHWRDNPAAPSGRGRAAPSRRRRPTVVAPQPSRASAGHRSLPRAQTRIGCTSSTSRTTRAHRSTCTRRCA